MPRAKCRIATWPSRFFICAVSISATRRAIAFSAISANHCRGRSVPPPTYENRSAGAGAMARFGKLTQSSMRTCS